MLRRSHPRRGAVLVEAALVYPVVILLIVGMIVVGLGVSRYQQVARLAREGARYAAVHGSTFQSEVNPGGQGGLPLKATEADIRDYIISRSAGLDAGSLTVTVTTWSGGSWVAWDANSASTYTDSSGNLKRSSVRVRVDYTWAPEAYLGTVTLSSTAEIPMGF